MPGFHLSKWYLDFVTEAGDASIFYSGSVRWGVVRLAFSSVAECQAGKVKVRSSMSSEAPQVDGRSLSWRSPLLGGGASWLSEAEPLRETIFRSGSQSVEWHCLMP